MTNDTAFISVSSPERLEQYKVLHKSISRYTKGRVDQFLYYGGEQVPEHYQGTSVTEWVKKSPYTNDWYKYCHIRPRCILDAFKKGYRTVILLGTDTEFFDTPWEILTFANDYRPGLADEAFVTMYTYHPYPDDDEKYPNDWHTVDVGQILADCIGFRNTPTVIKFLEWLDKTLETKLVFKNKVMLDQGWMSCVFSYVDRVKICRHWGYNVGNYNMFLRGLNRTNQAEWKMGDGDPLVLFHYAGFEKGREAQISKHQNRYKASGDILEFLENYTRKLNEKE